MPYARHHSPRGEVTKRSQRRRKTDHNASSQRRAKGALTRALFQPGNSPWTTLCRSRLTLRDRRIPRENAAPHARCRTPRARHRRAPRNQRYPAEGIKIPDSPARVGYEFIVICFVSPLVAAQRAERVRRLTSEWRGPPAGVDGLGLTRPASPAGTHHASTRATLRVIVSCRQVGGRPPGYDSVLEHFSRAGPRFCLAHGLCRPICLSKRKDTGIEPQPRHLVNYVMRGLATDHGTVRIAMRFRQLR